MLSKRVLSLLCSSSPRCSSSSFPLLVPPRDGKHPCLDKVFFQLSDLKVSLKDQIAPFSRTMWWWLCSRTQHWLGKKHLLGCIGMRREKNKKKRKRTSSDGWEWRKTTAVVRWLLERRESGRERSVPVPKLLAMPYRSGDIYIYTHTHAVQQSHQENVNNHGPVCVR